MKTAARKTSTVPTRIWKFAAQIEPKSASDAGWILFASNRYYNDLVEIEQARHARFAAVRRKYAPALGVLEDRWAKLDDQICDLYRSAKEMRQAHWQKSGGEKRRLLPPEYAEKVEALAKEKKRVSDEAKAHRALFTALLAPTCAEYKRRTKSTAGPRAKAKVNERVLAEMLAEDDWCDAWKDIARSDDKAHRAVLAARSQCGLFAGTYLGVEEAFRRAKEDCQPRPPGFRNYSGKGAIRLQTRDMTFGSWHRSEKRLTIEPLTRGPNAGPRSNMVRVTLDQSKNAAVMKVSAICKLHRLPPEDAVIKWVALMIRRRGKRDECQLQLTMEHPNFTDPKRPAGVEVPVHIQIGWAKTPNGIRVAHWDDDEVLCPDTIRGQKEFADHLESVRDRLAGKAMRRLRLVLYHAGNRFSAAGWRDLSSDRMRDRLRQWCFQYALFVLGDGVQNRWVGWKKARKARGKDLYAELHALRDLLSEAAHESLAWWCWLWAHKDLHLEEYARASRLRFERRRDAHYRAEAIRIATRYESVTVDSYSIAKLKKLAPLTMPGTGVRDIPQSQLHDAAPGRFREILLEVLGPCGSTCEQPGNEGSPEGARTENHKPIREDASGALESAVPI
jgi:hypothetical protein